MDNKTNQAVLYGIVGLLLGVLLAGYSANTNNATMMRMMGMNQAHDIMNGSGMDMSMSAMNDSLKGKTGDEFDKAFLTQMIIHHQGAILMAEEAKKSAKHDEIKKMADDIITAQSREITQMKDWYKSWYGVEVNVEDLDYDAPMMH